MLPFISGVAVCSLLQSCLRPGKRRIDRASTRASSMTPITAICMGLSASAEIGSFVSTTWAAQWAAVAR